MQMHEYIACPWQPFKHELLNQWRRLRAEDIQQAGPNRRSLARVIAGRYGIAWQLVENYLANLEVALMPRRTA